MKFFGKTIVALLLTGVASLANANLIVNGSFEDNIVTNSSTWGVYNSINGWSTLSGAGIEIQRNTIVTAQDGKQYVELDSHNNSSMFQQLTGLSVGESYLLSFWYHARTNNASNDNGIDVSWGTSAPGDLQLAIANETVQSTNNMWVEKTLSLFADQSTMYLTFAATGLNNSLGGFIDNVSLTKVASVPESSGLVLFGLGLMGLIAVRRRTK
ncbi:MAG TPA: DUF642 domain-containing protein [Cellvibrio sp.]|nr:DUF642 domain-containing protein [Cellvibrio sp.]